MVLLGDIPVIVAEFLAFLNIALGNNPDRAFRYQDVTIRVARMVDVAGFVLGGLAINIVAVIEIKNVGVALRDSPQAFGFGNPRPDVLNNPRPFFDLLGGKQSFA